MDRLKELRLNKKLLQKDVAKVIGVDRTTYVKYENGQSEPNFDIISRVADFFDVSTDYLLGRDEQKKGPATISDDGLKNPLRIELEKIIEDFDETKLKLLLERAELLDRMHMTEDS